jgi:hypothetical protein
MEPKHGKYNLERYKKDLEKLIRKGKQLALAPRVTYGWR